MKNKQEIIIVEVSKDGSTFTLENKVRLTKHEMKKLEAITQEQIVFIKDFTKPWETKTISAQKDCLTAAIYFVARAQS